MILSRIIVLIEEIEIGISFKGFGSVTVIEVEKMAVIKEKLQRARSC
jgi:hypothetical protein